MLEASFDLITNGEGTVRTDYINNLADDTYRGEVTNLIHTTFDWNKTLDPTVNDTDVDTDDLPDEEHPIPIS